MNSLDIEISPLGELLLHYASEGIFVFRFNYKTRKTEIFEAVIDYICCKYELQNNLRVFTQKKSLILMLDFNAKRLFGYYLPDIIDQQNKILKVGNIPNSTVQQVYLRDYRLCGDVGIVELENFIKDHVKIKTY